MPIPNWKQVATAFALLGSGACAEAETESASAEPAQCSVAGLALSAGVVAPPGHIFGDVPDVSLLPDSGFVAVDRQADQIQIFSSLGELRSTLGRAGEGPGEFNDPIGIEVVDGDAFVWDWGQSRVTRYNLESGVAEVTTLAAQANPTHHFGVLQGARVMTGTMTGTVISENENDVWNRDLGIVVTDLTSARLDTAAHVADQVVAWVDKASRRTGSPLFSPRAAAITSGGGLVWTRGDQPLILRATDTGVDSIQWDWPITPVTSEDVEAQRELWLAARPEWMHPSINQTIDAMPPADFFPVLGALVPDLDGGLWAQVYVQPRDSVRTWLRFEADQLTCQVELPRGFIAKEGGRSWLLGVTTGELDVQRVERWAIHPGQP